MLRHSKFRAQKGPRHILPSGVDFSKLVDALKTADYAHLAQILKEGGGKLVFSENTDSAR